MGGLYWEGSVVSPDVKSLYTNVPVEGATKTALKELYSTEVVAKIPSQLWWTLKSQREAKFKNKI